MSQTASWSSSITRAARFGSVYNGGTGSKDARRSAQAAADDPAAIFAFDLLWLDGADFRGRTLLQRKDALYRTLPANRRVRYAAHIPHSRADLWQLANAMDLEGIVAKRADSPYLAGRSDAWVKVKTTVAEERERERGRH